MFIKVIAPLHIWQLYTKILWDYAQILWDFDYIHNLFI
jgi:hypothetical protein